MLKVSRQKSRHQRTTQKPIIDKANNYKYMESLKERWNAKTPEFWKKVQRVGIIAGAIGGALLAVPVTLPAALITGATYLVVIGTTTATISQLTKE